MQREMCRLCLTTEQLIYLFDGRLKHQQQVRNCVLLCTGIHIAETDEVSKFVCNSCCTIAIKLFKFRKNAVANDKVLKAFQKQERTSATSSTSAEDFDQFHTSLVENITTFKKQETNTTCDDKRKSPVLNVNEATEDCSEASQSDIDLPLPVIELSAVYSSSSESKECTTDTNGTHGASKKDESPILSDAPKTKENESLTPAWHNITYITENHKQYQVMNDRKRDQACMESSEIVPTKRKRTLTKENEIRLKLESPIDSELTNTIFTSSLEPTSTEKDNVNDQPSLQQTKQAECNVCGKTYLGRRQMRIHQKLKHNDCLICHTNHSGQTISLLNLKKQCFRYMRQNQPNLSLARVDDVPELVRNYQDAFVRHKSAADDDVIIIDEPDARSEPFDTPTPDEKQNLLRIFNGYRATGDAAGRGKVANKLSQTNLAASDELHPIGNEITITNLYEDLSTYIIPVTVFVKQKWSACVWYERKPKCEVPRHDWNPSKAFELRQPIGSEQILKGTTTAAAQVHQKNVSECGRWRDSASSVGQFCFKKTSRTDSKPTDSDESSSDGQRFLRVKSPWELNQI